MQKKFNLKKWYKSRGFTQIEFAKMINRNRETIRLIENGESVKDIILIKAFCELYDIKKEIK